MNSYNKRSKYFKEIGFRLFYWGFILQVKFQADCPLPPISPQWIYYCDPVARSWKDYYIHRFEAYTREFQPQQTFVNLNDP